MKQIILTVVAAVLFFSCSSTSYSYRAVEISKDEVIAQQVVVDVKVDLKNKISSTSSKRNSIDEAIDEAYYKAIVDNNVDVVVDPIFEVKTSDKFLFFGGKSTAKLTGFGARYENARNKVEAVKELKSIDTNDVKNFNALYKSTKSDANSKNKPGTIKKKNKWWLWAGVAAVAAILFG
jgi:acyl-CoA-binding protein